MRSYQRIKEILLYGYLYDVRHFIRPIFKVFGYIFNKWKWNGGLCRKCNGRWFLDSYDSDRIWIEKYCCTECKSTLYSTRHLKELSDVEAISKRRDNILNKIVK